MYNHNHTPHVPITGYQVRVVLCDVQPVTWRRFLLRSDNTFSDLHQAIQSAFGWISDFLYRLKLNDATISSFMFVIKPVDHEHCWQIFTRYDNKAWSYADCSLLWLGRELKIATVIGFDHHLNYSAYHKKRPA